MEDGVRILLQDCLQRSGLTSAQAAHRAAVSPSTVHRILHGQVSPSVETLEKLVAACGMALTAAASPASDPRAAAAARTHLDHTYSPGDADLGPWPERLLRWAGNDPVAIVEEAGAATGVMRRSDSRYLTGAPRPLTAGRVASAGTASGQRWALSGPAGLMLPAFSDPLPAITIMWCEDTAAIGQLLTGSVADATAPHRAQLVLAVAEPELFAGEFEHDQVRYAAPIQIVIDAISLGGATAEAARKEVQTW